MKFKNVTRLGLNQPLCPKCRREITGRASDMENFLQVVLFALSFDSNTFDTYHNFIKKKLSPIFAFRHFFQQPEKPPEERCDSSKISDFKGNLEIEK